MLYGETRLYCGRFDGGGGGDGSLNGVEVPLPHREERLLTPQVAARGQ